MTIAQGQAIRTTFGVSRSMVVAPVVAISGGWRFAFKEAVDRAIAVLALLVLAPLLVAIALAVRLSSIGPVIFRQRRVGRGGETFDLLKFRTMFEASGVASFAPALGTAPGGIEGADRRTAVGRWLRATSLDELPQLLNVLRGEMSLIGPRPERREFVELFAAVVPGYTGRLRVKSGITGWAQAHGLRGQTSIVDRVEFDNYYIEHWSFGLDLRILALTVVELLRFRDRRPDLVPERLAPNTAIRSACARTRVELVRTGRGRRLARAARENKLTAIPRRDYHRGSCRSRPARNDRGALLTARSQDQRYAPRANHPTSCGVRLGDRSACALMRRHVARA